MNIYILPFSKDELNDKLFLGHDIQERTFPLWSLLKIEGGKKGLNFHTLDLFDEDKAAPDDALLVLNHPEENFWWRIYYLWKYRGSRGGFVWGKRELFYRFYKFFSRRVLLQLEPPVAGPTAYRLLPKLAGLYTDIYLIAKGFGEHFGFTHFIYDSYDRDKMLKKYFDRPKDKFLVMINANNTPHYLLNELYGERIKAVKFFSRYPDFDLYGPRWDRQPKHPLWWFRGDFIRKAWCGVVDDKWETLSRYKFALVFENCAYPGYVSEKIFDCFVTGVVPIYLGAPDVTDYIPPQCFIDFRKFKDYQELKQFLRNMPEDKIRAYRAAAMEFFAKNKDYEFTTRHFVNFLITTLSSASSQLNKGELKLHLGCGDNYLAGYLNTDLPPSRQIVVKTKADLYADIRVLDYPEDPVDKIRSHHVFEHFSRQEALKLLANWRRWLKVGRFLIVGTPDVETAFRMFVATGDVGKRFKLLRHIFGSHETDWACHKDGWWELKFRFIFEQFGFKDIECEKTLACHGWLQPRRLGRLLIECPLKK